MRLWVGGYDCKGRVGLVRRKLGRSQISEWAVRPELVIVFAEGFDQFAGGRQVDKFVFVEALIAELPVEAFDVAVLGGFAWGDEAVGDLAIVGPASQPSCPP